MADSQILMELQIVEKGGKISIVAQNMEKLAKETNKVNDAQNKAAKSGNKFHKGQKGVAQAGMNTTKSFSKMQETMGGSSGLVGAYATLAANVFAATAAFNALRQAAQVQTLAEGFGFLAGASGRSSEIIAGNIQSITGNALSMEESLRTAAIGIQSGFSSTQLERLTEVAKNASIALGRNLGDSVDRLVRGVAKLEPEILDELGIIVRLESATQKYAATINKNASDLSEYERQQAFLNATLEQGELKYGAIADAVDANPFDKLAGSFTNLSNKVLGFISSALSPLVSLFSNSQLAMAGALTIFGSTIVTQMLPGLADLTTKQLENAAAARTEADAQEKAGEKIAKAQRKIVAAGSDSVASPAGFEKLQKQLKRGKASAKTMQDGLDSLRRSERARAAALDKYSGEELKNKQAELKEIRRLKAETEELIRVEANRGKASLGGIAAAGRADRADIVARGVGDIQGAGGLEGFKIAFKENTNLRKSLKATRKELKGAGGGFMRFGRSALAGFRTAGAGAKLFGTALLNAIPVIGQIIFVVGAAFTVLNKMFGASEKVNGALKQMTKFTDSQAKSTEAFNTVQERLNKKIAESGDAYEIAQLQAQKYANRVKFSAGVAGEFGDSVSKLQQSLQDDGASKFVVIMDSVKRAMSSVFDSVKQIPDKISALIKKFVEMGAKLPKRLGGSMFQGMLDDINKSEEAVKRGSNEFTLFSRKTLDAFNSITDVGLREAIEKEFAQEGGLANALDIQGFINSGKDFNTVSKDISDRIANIGKDYKAADASIETFSKGYQNLNKTMSKEIQAKRAANDFIKLKGSIDGLIKDVTDMDKTLGPENVLGQIQRMSSDGELTTGLKNLGFTMADLVDAANPEGKLAEFSKFLEEAYEREQNFKNLKETAKETVKILESEKKKRLEIFGIEQRLENLRTRGTFELDGQARLKVAKEVFKEENTLREEKRAQDIALAQAQTQVNIDNLRKAKDIGVEERTERIALENELLATKLKAIDEESAYTLLKLKAARAEAFDAAGTSGTTADRIRQLGEVNLFGTEKDKEGKEVDVAGIQERISKIREAFSPMMEDLKAISPEGELYAAISGGALNIASAISTIGDAAEDTGARLEAIGSVFQSFGAIANASSKARIAGLDSEIAAEKKRDGKSKESVQKIAALEKKKEAMKRKQFETDKKTKIAVAVANTAAAMMEAAKAPPGLPATLPMVAMAGVMGAMQIAAIAKTQYAGGGTSSVAKPPSSINVGKRDNRVDVSKAAKASEIAYLRGQKGTGTNANNFTPGGAAGMRRGYAAGGEGILVGERGPEVVKPSAPIDVIPNDALNKTPTNVNFTINAVDSAGVQELLLEQRGNIIGMIREAAHEHGEEFMEPVNVEAY